MGGGYAGYLEAAELMALGTRRRPPTRGGHARSLTRDTGGRAAGQKASAWTQEKNDDLMAKMDRTRDTRSGHAVVGQDEVCVCVCVRVRVSVERESVCAVLVRARRTATRGHRSDRGRRR